MMVLTGLNLSCLLQKVAFVCFFTSSVVASDTKVVNVPFVQV